MRSYDLSGFGSPWFHTALVCDVLDRLGEKPAYLGPEVIAIDHQMKLAGKALTLSAEPASLDANRPYGRLFEAYRRMQAGDVIVIGGSHSADSGLWGELLSIAAVARGVAGVVTAGLVRDVDQLRQMGFATFSRGATPIDSAGRHEIGAIGERVTLGDLTVANGDLVFADAMGVVVVPAELGSKVVELCAGKAAAEDVVRRELAEGQDVGEVFDRYGIL